MLLRSLRLKSALEITGEFVGLGPQTSTMLDARALEPVPIILFDLSVRIGHVPSRDKPDLIRADKKASQPVLEVVPPSDRSDCLNA